MPVAAKNGLPQVSYVLFVEVIHLHLVTYVIKSMLSKYK